MVQKWKSWPWSPRLWLWVQIHSRLSWGFCWTESHNHLLSKVFTLNQHLSSGLHEKLSRLRYSPIAQSLSHAQLTMYNDIFYAKLLNIESWFTLYVLTSEYKPVTTYWVITIFWFLNTVLTVYLLAISFYLRMCAFDYIINVYCVFMLFRDSEFLAPSISIFVSNIYFAS